MSRTVYLETFGCQMNELDSELVSGQLRAMGYRFTADPAHADVVLYNTCSVREHAEQKVWSRLGELRIRKAEHPTLVVGVLGCMAERDGESLIRRMPVVDVLCGPGELDKLPALLDNAVRTRESIVSEATNGPAGRAAGSEFWTPPGPETVSASLMALQGNTSRRSATLAAAADSLEMLDLSRSISATDDDGKVKRSAYVRITRGCNKFCTYCVVPFTRGAEVHRPPQHIVDECRKLADAGVVEITLLGQTVNHYRFEHGAAVSIGGVTQPQKGRSYTGGHRRDPFTGTNVTTFADLLAMIHEQVPQIMRLRFVTSYPRDFGDDVLEVIRDHPRMCRYLHVPAQSGSNRMLSLMNRGYTIEEYTEFLGRARGFLHQPEIGRPLMVSSDFIVGFPGETDEDFDATMEFTRKARFKNSFIFKYSPRPGTVAIDKYPDDVPEAVKRQRNNQLLAIQNEISHEIGREHIDCTVPVFVEGLSVREVRQRARAVKNSHGHVALTVGGRPAHDADEHAQPSACGTSSHVHAEPNNGVVQLSGRTDGDQIVVFDQPVGRDPETLIGSIVRVRVTAATGLTVSGHLVVE